MDGIAFTGAEITPDYDSLLGNFLPIYLEENKFVIVSVIENVS